MGRSWNAQAVFARAPQRHRRKKLHSLGLLSAADFVAVQEAHSTEGVAKTLRLPRGVRAWWSHGSAAVGGVGLLIKSSFLSKFKDVQDEDLVEAVPGRAAILRLDGPSGSLDIITVYMPTGQAAQERATI